jgi:hypothetical protein
MLRCYSTSNKAFSFLGTHFSTIKRLEIANKYFGVVLKYSFDKKTFYDLHLGQLTTT